MRKNSIYMNVCLYILSIAFLILAPGFQCTTLGADALEPLGQKGKTEGQVRQGNRIEDDQTSGASEPTQEAGLEKYGQKADEFQETVSAKLSATADWLDSFFRDERREIEENNSNLRLRFATLFEEDGNVDFKARARLRLALHGFEDKLHIMIAGDHDEDGTTKSDIINDLERGDNSDNDVNLALRYFFKAAKNNNISFKSGLRLNDFPPAIYAGPRFSFAKAFDPWLLRFTQDVRWYSDDGWESVSTFDFERSLSESLFLRTSAEGAWYQDDDGYFYELKCELYQVLNRDRALEYQWINYFETEPKHVLDEVLLRVKYRQRIWRQWLFLEMAPQVAFREEDDHDPIMGVTLAIEGFFGKERMKDWDF